MFPIPDLDPTTPTPDPCLLRYIGNKTKLLGFIADLLDHKRIRPARAFDAFSGTAAVGRFLKERGASVVSCDLMTFSYVFQRAYIVADRYPCFTGLADDADLRRARARPDFAPRVDHRVARRRETASAPTTRESAPTVTRALDEVLVYLDSYLDPHESFISRQFAAPHPDPLPPARVAHGRAHAGAAVADVEPAASPLAGRMYFALDRARRIDAIRERIHDWHLAGAISDDEFYLLLAALLEAADAVANTTGIYAAYIKQWQPNALRDLRLRLPAIVPRPRTRPRCEAFLGDVSRIATDAGRFDLLYLDPPYNTRQYSAYYHVPEIIARGWFGEPPVLRGKTGLPTGSAKSAWSTRAQCVRALERLIETVDADHIIMSYNCEGIIPDADIERIFRHAGRRDSFVRVAREYQRYRSDSPGPARQYKAHSVREHLYYVRTKPRRAR